MRHLLTFAASVYLLIGCSGGGGKRSAQIQDSLQTVISQQDTLITTVLSSIDQIVSSLQTINERQGVIASTAEKSPQGRASDAINELDSILSRNRRTIGTLQGSVEIMRQAKLNADNLQNLIMQLMQQVDNYDLQIVKLRTELAERNTQVGSLSAQISGLDGRRTQLEDQVRTTGELLNQAYYVADSRKELLRNNIISSRGLFVRTLTVNERMNLSSFTKTDIRTFDHVQIDGGDPTLVSSHPSGSYKLNQDTSGHLWLYITDKQAFWKYTKVLIVCYK